MTLALPLPPRVRPAAEVRHGDCVALMRDLPAESVDAIVCDPPYGLGFMGRAWDALPPGVDWAAECLRVLKPGGHIVAFGGTRTVHRLACAIEDTGLEIRDTIHWCYWSGFPKSLDVSKAVDKAGGALTGFGTALKPAVEPAVLARRPLVGTVAANVLKHGTGALNIDGCRFAPGAKEWPGPGENYGRSAATADGKRPSASYSSYGWGAGNDASYAHTLGRFPANLVHVPKATGRERNRGAPNSHPTVKPVRLMRWLCRLVTPPGGLVLDPFAGSGSCGVAAVLEGFGYLGMELQPEYVDLARARIRHAVEHPEQWADTTPGRVR